MTTHLIRSGLTLLSALGTLGAGRVTAQVVPDSITCFRPATLETRLRSHADANTYAESGAWFEAHRKFACAARDYRLAAQLNPSSAHLKLALGSNLLASGDPVGAETALRQSITLDPKSVEAHQKLAILFERLQRNDEAEEEWNAARQCDSKNSVTLDGLARHLLAAGNYAAVIRLLESEDLTESLAADLAQAYGRGGSLTDAEKTAKKALAQAPGSFPLTSLLTSIVVDLGRFQEATKLAENYAKAHPSNLEAQRLFLRLLVTTNDFSRAKPFAKSLLRQAPRDAYFLYVNGMLERQDGDYASARTHLLESVALDPDFDSVHYNLGLVQAKFKDFESARAEFEKAIALGGQEPEIRFQLSKALSSLGRQDEADRQLNRYREMVELQSKSTVAQAKAALAEKELASGEVQRAITLYREALDSTPDDALLNFKLGMALDKTGNIDAEKRALEMAIHLDPDMAIAHNQLGYLASRSGDSASAEGHFREAVRAAPAYAEAWVNLAATLGMESKFSEAQQAIANAIKADPNNAQALQLRQELSIAQ